MQHSYNIGLRQFCLFVSVACCVKTAERIKLAF